MRSARLLMVAVLAVVAVALPIQSAFATLTLDINPNPVVVGGWITFSGTGAGPFEPFFVSIWHASDQCAGPTIAGDGGSADDSGNYLTTHPSGSLGVGQYVAQTQIGAAASPCVAFTVIEGPAVGAVEVPFIICVIQLGVQESGGTITWLPGYAYLDVPIPQCQDMTGLYTDVLGRTIAIHQFTQTRIS